MVFSDLNTDQSAIIWNRYFWETIFVISIWTRINLSSSADFLNVLVKYEDIETWNISRDAKGSSRDSHFCQKISRAVKTSAIHHFYIRKNRCTYIFFVYSHDIWNFSKVLLMLRTTKLLASFYKSFFEKDISHSMSFVRLLSMFYNYKIYWLELNNWNYFVYVQYYFCITH